MILNIAATAAVLSKRCSMSSKKVWYVEAFGHANEVIAGDLPAENAHKGVLCIDGKNRDLWQCDYRFITKLKKNRWSCNLVFKVWYRQNPDGPIREWPFLNKKKPMLASALKKGTVKRLNPVVV